MFVNLSNLINNSSTTDVSLSKLAFTRGLPGNKVSYSEAEKAVIITVLSLIPIIAVVGNLFVCVAVFLDYRLRNNSNFFIVSLAVADLLVAVAVMTFGIVNDMGRWVFGAVFCRLWISMDVMCSTASILNLCVISLDRYMHIKDPLAYEVWMTTKKTVLFIFTVWVLSAVIAFAPVQLGWHELPASKHFASHAELCLTELNPYYALLSSIVCFYIPCVVMVSVYVRLYIYAQRQADIIHTKEVHFTGSRTRTHWHKADHKAAVTIGVIMGAFLVCWLPFFVIFTTLAFCGTCVSPLVFQICTWLGYVNSCVNPIIYSIFNTEFKEAFLRILFPKLYRARRSRAFSSDVFRRTNRCSQEEAGTVRRQSDSPVKRERTEWIKSHSV